MSNVTVADKSERPSLPKVKFYMDDFYPGAVFPIEKEDNEFSIEISYNPGIGAAISSINMIGAVTNDPIYHGNLMLDSYRSLVETVNIYLNSLYNKESKVDSETLRNALTGNRTIMNIIKIYMINQWIYQTEIILKQK